MNDRIASLLWLVAFIAVLWTVWLVNAVFFDYRFNQFGLAPRTAAGLWGIPFSPFLHASLEHLLSNTIPLAILGGLAAVRGRNNFLLASVFIILMGGAGLWLIGRPWPLLDSQPLVHVGASGLIFGYFGYLVARGWYERSFLSILVALLVIGVFGWGMLVGLAPTAGAVSWEGHLCGLLAGLFYARLTLSRFRSAATALPGPD